MWQSLVPLIPIMCFNLFSDIVIIPNKSNLWQNVWHCICKKSLRFKLVEHWALRAIVFSRIHRGLNSDHVWNPLQARLSQCNWLECQSSAQGAPWCNWCKHELHLWVHTEIKLCPHWTLVLFDNCLFACQSLLWPREDISICDNIKDSFTHQHWHQGCIFRLMCSYPELTEDHVLPSA